MDDGVLLAGDVLGPADGAPVILAHGGGQTRFAWKKAAWELADRGFRALAYDARGHGESGWSPDGDYSIDRFERDLSAIVDTMGGPSAVIGASLGGLTALLAAGEGKAPISALVLVDITPTIEPAGALAIVSFMKAHLDDGFATIEDAADAISSFLPRRRRPEDLSGLRKNLTLGTDGRWRWHWDPALVQGARAVWRVSGVRERFVEAARRLTIPVLLVRGAHSEVVSDESVEEFRRLVPHAEYRCLQDASHMVAGDTNEGFTATVVDFLDRVRASE
jgi:pimeloyl-ACP methyl ester carboxylesterase